MSNRVFVVGATGGVGQLIVAKLLEQEFVVRILTRSADKAQQMFGDRVEVVMGDIRQPETLSSATQGISSIICTTGTTAFPSDRWEFDLPTSENGLQPWTEWAKIYLDANYRNARAKNSPDQVDARGVANLVNAAPKDLQRFVFVSSCGVERKDQFPYSLLNSFGVLDAKQQGEAAIISSGLPYTILRPGRLIDGPYTSYDLNTLLKATTNSKVGVAIAPGDTLSGQTSRIDVAAACVACLRDPNTIGKVFSIVSQGPRPTPINWADLFAQLM